MSDDTYRTATGRVLTDADVEALAEEAERGYDVAELATKPTRRRGRQPLAGTPLGQQSPCLNVRMDAATRAAVYARAAERGVTPSVYIREVLREHLGL